MGNYTVGEAAEAAEVTARAIRLYEARGLIPRLERTASGYRLLSAEDIETLTFIRQARSLGLSLEATTEIIELAAEASPCERTRALLDERVTEIDTTIEDLLKLRERIVATQKIEGGPATRCAVIEAVSDEVSTAGGTEGPRGR